MTDHKDHSQPIDTDKDLNDAFGSKGTQTAPSPFRHPAERDIIKNAYELLNSIPAGQELIPTIKRYDVRIEVTVGREPNVVTMPNNTINLIVPKNLNGVNEYEIACNLGIGLREIELNNTGNQLVTGDMDSFYFRAVDTVMLMCRLVNDYEILKGHTKLVDLMAQLGHSKVYGQYKSQASNEVMKETIITAIKKEMRAV